MNKNNMVLYIRNISSGIYDYPKSEAIKIATRAIKDFLEDDHMEEPILSSQMNFDAVSEVVGCVRQCVPIANDWKENIERHREKKEK